MSEHSFGCRNCGQRVLLGSNEYRDYSARGTDPHNKEALAPDIDSVEAK